MFTEIQLGQAYSFSRSSLYSRKFCKSSGLFKEVANGEPKAVGKEFDAVGKESDAVGEESDAVGKEPAADGYCETVGWGFEVAV